VGTPIGAVGVPPASDVPRIEAQQRNLSVAGAESREL
jgi:hypothetical protein